VAAVSRQEWLRLEPAERVEVVARAAPDWPEVAVLDAPTRWEVIVDSTVRDGPGAEGDRLMAFESALRERLRLPIEVYSPPAGDLSKLRQKLRSTQQERVDDWFARREATRTLGTG